MGSPPFRLVPVDAVSKGPIFPEDPAQSAAPSTRAAVAGGCAEASSPVRAPGAQPCLQLSLAVS